MNTFIVLTYIGTLSYVYANNITTISECKRVTPMVGFNASNFFKDKWYVTHVKNVTIATVCDPFDTSEKDGKLIAKYESHKNDDGKNNQLLCEGKRQENTEMFSFGCTVDGQSILQADVTVMGTDYDNYAVFYRCVTFESAGSKADNYLVISRKNDSKEIPEMAKNLTEGLDLTKCSDISQSSCHLVPSVFLYNLYIIFAFIKIIN